jgi:2-polyprenyl-3-methyl-5-hydroxy-6-metoxy-1,4-benzoquinol methylase
MTLGENSLPMKPTLDSEDQQFEQIDVLEHIEDDKSELARAVSHLRPGGRLVVLSPANQWLFSEFDRSTSFLSTASASRSFRSGRRRHLNKRV